MSESSKSLSRRRFITEIASPARQSLVSTPNSVISILFVFLIYSSTEPDKSEKSSVPASIYAKAICSSIEPATPNKSNDCKSCFSNNSNHLSLASSDSFISKGVSLVSFEHLSKIFQASIFQPNLKSISAFERKFLVKICHIKDCNFHFARQFIITICHIKTLVCRI